MALRCTYSQLIHSRFSIYCPKTALTVITAAGFDKPPVGIFPYFFTRNNLWYIGNHLPQHLDCGVVIKELPPSPNQVDFGVENR